MDESKKTQTERETTMIFIKRNKKEHLIDRYTDRVPDSFVPITRDFAIGIYTTRYGEEHDAVTCTMRLINNEYVCSQYTYNDFMFDFFGEICIQHSMYTVTLSGAFRDAIYDRVKGKYTKRK